MNLPSELSRLEHLEPLERRKAINNDLARGDVKSDHEKEHELKKARGEK